uniref:RES family NAD+ phosphorylase n=1 Tax=Cellvibrio fontiphilus TaxID=1815559 RepID=UPI002B4BF332|nr:RES family NAD+ phosphorylase [Cellvibrio fontiphilus]
MASTLEPSGKTMDGYSFITPEWKHYRVIHSRFPPRNLFDEDPATQNLLAELEAATSDRLYRWRECVAEEDARFGDGWGAVMASFCYIRPGRFNTAAFGAYYCANSVHTAIAEWSHHAAKVWRDHGFDDQASAVVRAYIGSFKQSLIDLREQVQFHHPDNYFASQACAVSLREQGCYGVVYTSLRHPTGLAAALFRPPATSSLRQSAHYSVRWDGTRFVEFAKLNSYEKL